VALIVLEAFGSWMTTFAWQGPSWPGPTNSAFACWRDMIKDGRLYHGFSGY
jgi:hypothetical protein